MTINDINHFHVTAALYIIALVPYLIGVNRAGTNKDKLKTEATKLLFSIYGLVAAVKFAMLALSPPDEHAEFIKPFIIPLLAAGIIFAIESAAVLHEIVWLRLRSVKVKTKVHVHVRGKPIKVSYGKGRSE